MRVFFRKLTDIPSSHRALARPDVSGNFVMDYVPASYVAKLRAGVNDPSLVSRYEVDALQRQNDELRTAAALLKMDIPGLQRGAEQYLAGDIVSEYGRMPTPDEIEDLVGLARIKSGHLFAEPKAAKTKLAPETGARRDQIVRKLNSK